MKTHLVRWHKDYAKKGLVIIDVDDGAMDSFAEVKSHAATDGVKFPILWDKDEKNTRTYGVRGMPSAFLVGVDGKVIWEGFPLAGVGKVEERIKAELKKVKKKAAGSE